MGLISGVLGFIVGLTMAVPVAYIVYLRFFAARHLQDLDIRPLRALDNVTLQTTIPEIPVWVKGPDYERVDWMNSFLLDIWPCLEKAICNTIKSVTRPILDEYVGQYGIKSIEFAELTLGALPPTFQGIKAYEMRENVLIIEPVIRWASTTNIILRVQLNCIEVAAQLVDLHIILAPRVTLKPLVPTFPCFANLYASLMEKPHIDFGLKLVGADIMAIPGLYQLIQDQISEQISVLYHWPKALQIPILDESSVAIKKPVGILHVKVVRALDLMKADFLGKSDPYVKISLRGEKMPSKKTSIKMNNLNPEWNEDFRFAVKDPNTQVLELHLFDWEKVKRHDKLGMQVIPLRMVAAHESKLFTLELLRSLKPNDAQNKKNRGRLVVELTYVPFKDDNWNSSVDADDDEGSSSNDVVERTTLSCAGILLVSVQNAQDVEGKRHTNPYAVVTFRGEEKKTTVIRRTRDPRWNEEFEFTIDEPPVGEMIHIEVRSKSRGIPFKESLGHVNISLADVIRNGRINETYNLINSKNGTIHVKLQWSSTT